MLLLAVSNSSKETKREKVRVKALVLRVNRSNKALTSTSAKRKK